ncbi:MAG: spore coat protein CotJB [Clostridia bacterium]|nr:spore coat protein CotJB [Clostridia bacterium]
MSKSELKRKIFELDFAIHELVLFLNSHPTSKKAMQLLDEYRDKRRECIAAYEERFGEYIVHADDTPASACWKWLEGPWPWENNFMEG